MELRDYQKEAILNLRKALKQGHKRILLSLPTGAGKTIIAKAISELMLQKNKRLIFTANRKELITQTIDKFKNDDNCSILMGNNKGFDVSKPIQVCTIQTLTRRDIDLNPDVIIIDECHWGHSGNMFKKLFETYPETIVIGLSATPIDEKGLKLKGYDHIIQNLATKHLIEKGHLVDVKCFAPIELNLDNIAIKRNDYDNVELDKELNTKSHITNIVEIYKKYADNKKTVIFCISIEHSKKMAELFKNNNIPCEAIHSELKTKDREDILSDFANDKLQILTNVDVLTTGFDEPSIECLLFARPTKTLRLYIQMVGRGLRLFSGKKECLILDCANVINDNGFPTAIFDFSQEKKLKKGEIREIKPFKCGKCDEISEKPFIINKKDLDGKLSTYTKCPKCGDLVLIKETKEIKSKEMIEIKETTLDDIIPAYITNYKSCLEVLTKIAKLYGYKKGWGFFNTKKIKENGADFFLFSQLLADAKNRNHKLTRAIFRYEDIKNQINYENNDNNPFFSNNMRKLNPLMMGA